MVKNRFLMTFLLAILSLLPSYSSHSFLQTQASGPYNIVLILTDDQRWDTLCNGTNGLVGICDQPTDSHPMPTVETELLANGTIFTNAFASVPLCCPARASLLSGGFYAHHTNVLDNGLPNGGFAQFKDSTSLGTVLQQNGYKTALIGKYLNGYRLANNYVPPGWDHFVGQDSVRDWNSDYEHVVGSSTYDQPGTGTLIRTTDGTYLTDYQRDQALAFIDQNCQYQSCTAPFFIYLAPYAPHEPATPAPRHAGLFSDFLYRERGYGELPDGDLSDKPEYVHTLANQFDPAAVDGFSQKQLASLRAVDEAVAAILDNLTQKDLLNNTVFIFSGDNGYMWGEHKMTAKSKPYEESIRVPLIVRLPGSPPATVDRLVAPDLDLPPTILELAGITPLAGDGQSLTPLFSDPLAPWRSELLIQGGYQLITGATTWAGIITEDGWKYVEYVSGEKELYHLAPGEDPYELSSKHDDPAYQGTLADLANRLSQLNRGLAIKTDNLSDVIDNVLPAAFSGQSYTFQFTAWGGSGTYFWSIYNGDTQPPNQCDGGLPPGLVLDADGSLTGMPLETGTWAFCVQVEDTSVSPQPGNGRSQAHVRTFKLNVTPPPPGTLEGYITNALSGEPVNGASVTAGGITDLSAADGFYQIPSLPAGTYTVTASAAGYMPGTVSDVVVPVGGTALQDLALTPQACTSACLRSTNITMRTTTNDVKASVTVLDENGAAVSGATLSIIWGLPDGNTQNKNRTTNIAGIASFRITAVGPGTYTLTVTNITKTGYTFDPANSTLNASVTK